MWKTIFYNEEVNPQNHEHAPLANVFHQVTSPRKWYPFTIYRKGNFADSKSPPIPEPTTVRKQTGFGQNYQYAQTRIIL